MIYNKKIKDLTALTSLSEDDAFVVWDSENSETRKVATNLLASTIIATETILNYTELRAYSGTAKAVYIYGADTYTNAPNGTAGTFYLDNYDTISLDNGGTIIVDESGRRWKRNIDNGVNVMWFGAVGDGITSDYAAFSAAILSHNTILIPYYNSTGVAAVWYINSTLDLTNGKTITSTDLGIGRRPCIKQGANVLFDVKGSNVTITGLRFDLSRQTSEAHSVIRFRTDLTSVSATRIKNIRLGHSESEDGLALYGGYAFLRDMNSTYYLVDTMVEDVVGFGFKNSPIKLYDAFASNDFKKVVFDYTRHTSMSSHYAFAFDGFAGLVFEDCIVQGWGAATTPVAANGGFSLTNGAALIFKGNNRADTLGSKGFYFNNINGIEGNHIVGSLCADTQIHFEGVINLNIGNVWAIGRNEQSYAPSAKHGIYCYNVNGGLLSNFLSKVNTGSGLAVENSVTMRFSIGNTSYNTRYGVEELGTSNYNAFDGISMAGNAINNGVTVGANTQRVNIFVNSGAVLTSTIGAGTW